MKRRANIGRKQVLSRFILTAGASALALGMATGAQAQETEQPPQETVDQTTVDEAAIDEEAAAQPGERDIIVTGSRIPRPGFDTVRPIESITAEDLDKRAFTNIADALEELPTVEVDVVGDQDTFVLGQNFVDLFGLGSQRTLTLVNGRRFVSTNPQVAAITSSVEAGLQVNLAAIPTVLVERIDVAKLAAGAAVYGSDAIAGTINIILKDDFEGIDLRAQQGISERGDAGSRSIAGVLGVNSPDGRGNVAIAVQYDVTDSLLYSDRPQFGRDAPQVVAFAANLDQDGDGDVDTEFRIYDGRRESYFSEFGSLTPFSGLAFLYPGATSLGANFGGFPNGPGVPPTFYQFNSTGQLIDCTPGRGLGLFDFFEFGGTCGVSLFGAQALRPEVKRLNIAGIGHYDITDSIRFTTDVIVSQIKSVEPTNAFAVNAAAQFGALLGTTSGPLTFSTSNPFLSDQARQLLQSRGMTSFGVHRSSDDLIDDGRLEAENLAWRISSALSGDFAVGDRKFDWEVAAVFGSANLKSRQKTIIDGRFYNAIDAVRVDDAYLSSLIAAPGNTIADQDGDGVDADDALIALQNSGRSGVANIQRGSIICRVTGTIANGTVAGGNVPPGSNQIPGFLTGPYPFAEGCIPLNVFGDAQQLNSPEAINFVQGGGPVGSDADNKQRVLTASITGDLIKLPAGWLKGNVGVETRYERNRFDPGVGLTSGFGRFPPLGGGTGGELETREAFGEVLVPLLSPEMNIPFAHLLEINASARYVHDEARSRDGSQEAENDAWVYELGGRWSPIEDIIIRGSYTRAVRSPALVELFRADVIQNQFGQDPCDLLFVDNGVDPATRRANCIAEGIDPDTFMSNRGVFRGRSSGNPDLEPETSMAYNIGVVIQPRWIDRLALSVDYYNIEIEDQVIALGLTDILSACYDDPDFPNSEFCSDELFTRDPVTRVINFARTRPFNVATAKYSAIEGRLIWGSKVVDIVGGDSDLGDLNFDVAVLRQIENRTDAAGLDLSFNSVGSFSTPKWTATANVTYSIGNVRLFWRSLWQDAPRYGTGNDAFITDLGAGDEGVDATLDNIITDQIGDRWMHYASVQFEVMDKMSFQINVDNVFDRKPSRLEQAAGAFSFDEVFGRRYTASVHLAF